MFPRQVLLVLSLFTLLLTSCVKPDLLVQHPGDNDDPALLRARDGAYYLAFLSDRAGSKGLWISRSIDGKAWAAPVAMPNEGPESELYPTLLQASERASSFHLVYARVTGPGEARIYHRRVAYTSAGFSWGGETLVGQNGIDDQDPQAILVGQNELRVYFSSAMRGNKPLWNRDLFVARSRNGGASWEAPVALRISSPSENDRFPWVAKTSAYQFQLVFQRQAADSFVDATSDLFLATSSDGLTWGEPRQLTSDPLDGVHDLWPSIQWVPTYRKWYVLWTSTQSPVDGKGGILGFPLDQTGASPGSATNFSSAVGMGGWSPRLAPGTSKNSTLAVFVSNSRSSTPQLYGVTDSR